MQVNKTYWIKSLFIQFIAITSTSLYLIATFNDVSMLHVSNNMVAGAMTITMTIMLLELVYLLFDDYWEYRRVQIDMEFADVYPLELEEELEPEELEPKVKQEPTVPKTRNLSSLDNNPFVNGKYQLVNNMDSENLRLYNIDQYKFRLDQVAHLAIIGATGSAKTNLTFNLLRLIDKQYDHPLWAICDAGYLDFKQAMARETDEITRTIEMLHTVMLGRQLDGDRNGKRIMLVIEEAETYFNELKLLKKAERDMIFAKIAKLGVLARKTNISLVVIGQSLKTDVLQSNIRSNLTSRWLMKMSQNISSGSWNCPHNLEHLTIGHVYNNNANAFFEFKESTEPTLATLTFDSLEQMVRGYTMKYPQLKGTDDDDILETL